METKTGILPICPCSAPTPGGSDWKKEPDSAPGECRPPLPDPFPRVISEKNSGFLEVAEE